MGEQTAGIPTSAGTWENLGVLYEARRAALLQPKTLGTSARRITLIATGAVSYVKEPKSGSAGILLTPATPIVFGPGGELKEGESLRSFHVKGGGTLDVTLDYT